MLTMDNEFVKWFATLGVGGVLAGFMFMFYRKDVKQYTDLWKTTSDQMMAVIKDNTASNTKLISLIETQERNMVRKEDINNLIDRKLQLHRDTHQ
jgi:phosphate/sulfate permease